MNISLASFKESNDPDQIILIERSILQQMLYGSDANKLPYSRFKRISTPTMPLLKAIIVAIWCISALFLYKNNILQSIPSRTDSSFFLYVLSIAFIVSIPVTIISDIYKASFLTSFKKISLSNAEFETGDVSESSILNRHLDEIIYFFQSTNYDVVVIEDLDRFQSPDIFVKLREINKLINDNEGTKGNIKFLYALKDNMFEHKDRAKFFDFIIPVIPIINSSNSLDKMRERIQDGDSNWNICPQFLREASWYVDDLRLIHNIFNEFSIYHQILKSENLNTTKLLAIIIYKNVYPEDFELLHHGSGALYSIGQKRIELVAKRRKSITSEIDKIKIKIEKSNNEQLKSTDEIIKLFVGHLISESGVQNISSINSNRGQLQISNIKNWDDLQALMDEKNLIVYSQSYSYSQSQHDLRKSFSTMESELSPSASLLERKENIENKEAQKRFELEKIIASLEKEMSSLLQLPLSQLLQNNDEIIENSLTEFKLKDSRLFLYLIRNGYIDETYHLYTSFFHEGRMTKNDRDFLLAIRDFKKPDPNQTIDTPNEVLENMRIEDFSHKYALNVTLIDYLFSDTKKNSMQINSVLNYISNNFSETEDFFSAYWATGRYISTLTSMLSRNWTQYMIVALKTAEAHNHISLLLSYVSSDEVLKSMNIEGALTQYISEFSVSVFSSNHFSTKSYNSLKVLNIKVGNLDLISKNESLIDFLYLNNLYEINIINILFLMKKYSTIKNEYKNESQNYSSLSEPGCEALKQYVDSRLHKYISDVFLILPNNYDENFETITSLLQNNKISMDLKKEILIRNKLVFESIESIPKALWEHAISEDKVKPSWETVASYLAINELDEDIFTEKFQTQIWLDALTTHSISQLSIDEQKKKELSKFILGNDNLDISSYTALTTNLPYWYHDFPNVDDDKKASLAKNRIVRLTEKSFSSSEADNILISILIEKNPKEYFSSKDKYPLDNKVKPLLLASSLDISQKFEILQDIKLSEIKENRKLANIASEILAFDSVDCTKIDYEIMSNIIEYSASMTVAIQIIIKCASVWTEEKVMSAISLLPEPYSEIASYGKRPKLQRSKLNEQLTEVLKSRGFISSIKDNEGMIQINTFKSTDHTDG